jgi:hypothetical protein
MGLAMKLPNNIPTKKEGFAGDTFTELGVRIPPAAQS